MTITIHMEGTTNNSKSFTSMNIYDANKISTIAGTCVVVCVASDTAVTSVELLTGAAVSIRLSTTPSDSANNSGNVLVTVWLFPDMSSSELTDFCYVKCTTGSQAAAMTVYTIEGLATASLIDRRQSSYGSSDTPSSGTSLETNFAEEALIALVGTEGPVGDAAGTWGTDVDQNSQRNGTTGGGAASNITIASAAEAVSATGTFTASKSGITSRDWAALLVTLKPWSPPTQTLSGTGNIASGEAFGTAAVTLPQENLIEGAGNIASAEAFQAPSVNPKFITDVTSITSSEAFGWPIIRATSIAAGQPWTLQLSPQATPPRRTWTTGVIDNRALGTLNMKRDGVLCWFHADDLTSKATYAPSNIASGWLDDSGQGNHLTTYTGNTVQRYDYVESFGGAALHFIHQTTEQGTAFQALNGTHTITYNPRYIAMFYFRTVSHDAVATRYGGTNQHHYYFPVNWRMPMFIKRWGNTFLTGKNYLIIYLQNQGSYYNCHNEVWVNGTLADRDINNSRAVAAPSSLSTSFVLGDNTTYSGNHSFYWGEFAIWQGVYERKWINQMQYFIAQKYGLGLEEF